VANGITFFSTAYTMFDAKLADFLGPRLTAVISAVSGPLAVALAIYLALVGYAVLRGLVDEPWREWFYRILKLALVWAAVQSAGYNEWIVQPLFHDAPNAISQAVAGKDSSDAGTTFDDYVNATNPIAARLEKDAAARSPFDLYKLIDWSLEIALVILTGLSACIGFAIIVFAKVALAIIVALGPFFIALSLFNATRGLFYGFLNQAFNYIVLMGVVTAITALIVDVGSSSTANAAAQIDLIQAVFLFCIYVILGTIFFFQAPSIAAGIAGGAAAGVTDFARQTLGAGGATGRMFRAKQSRADRRASRAANRAMARGGSISNNS
jgi:type IV secretion system protein VirB6